MRDSALSKQPKNLGVPNNGIISFLKPIKSKERRHCKVKSLAPKPTTAELMKSSDRSFGIDSLIPRPQPMLLLKKWFNPEIRLASEVPNALLPNMAFKKKLHRYNPKNNQPEKIQTQRTKEKEKLERCDPDSIERELRQLLSNGISGNMAGVWLLIPEHLKLGTWNLLCKWSNKGAQHIQPRLAMQMVHEAALCISGCRQERTLSQKGFEIANGLPFVATDTAIHHLLNDHTIEEAQYLQLALGKMRLTLNDYEGTLLAIDPHRIVTYRKRQMPRRKKDSQSKPRKTAQTFFCIDAVTEQPICFLNGTSARSATNASIELLRLTEAILNPGKPPILVMADIEHYTVKLMDWVRSKSPFDLLVPMSETKPHKKQILSIPDEEFHRKWAGYATTKRLYSMKNSQTGPFHQFVQRDAECPNDYGFKAFLCTSDREETSDLSLHFPKRWHIEEFFNKYQHLGWQRAGTMNLNIQYGRMTMALLAQATLHHMRQKIGAPYTDWDARHLANHFLRALEGDIRVKQDTIIVTFYNPPNSQILRDNYEGLPQKLIAQGIDPRVPWLYDFKLDFRFR